MTPYTRQTAFDTVVRGLHGQGWQRSMLEGAHGAVCAYRSPDGMKCAAGHLIPDSVRLEGQQLSAFFSALYEDTPELRVFIPSDLLPFVSELQLTHDDARQPEQMHVAFYALAYRHNLVWPADVPEPEGTR